jgi:tape measure domain-containing protein
MAETIAELVVRLQGDVTDLQAKMATGEKAVKGSTDKISGYLKGLAVGAVAMGAAVQGIEFNKPMENARVAFGVMLGSAEKAKDMVQSLQVLATKTPLEFKDVQAAAKQLVAFGVAAGDITRTITMVGDVASGIGAPLGDMAYLFGTIKTQGKAMTQDLNQFANRGVPIFDELAKAMGVSTGEIRKMAEQGKIGFPEIEKAFTNMTSAGGKFYQMMALQAQTLAGAQSNLTDATDQMLGRMTEGAMGPLKEATTSLAAEITQVGKAATDGIGSTMGGAITAVSFIINGVVDLLGKVPGQFTMIGTAAAAGALAFGPIGAAIGAAAAVAAALVGAITDGQKAADASRIREQYAELAISIGATGAKMAGFIDIVKKVEGATLKAVAATSDQVVNVDILSFKYGGLADGVKAGLSVHTNWLQTIKNISAETGQEKGLVYEILMQSKDITAEGKRQLADLKEKNTELQTTADREAAYLAMDKANSELYWKWQKENADRKAAAESAAQQRAAAEKKAADEKAAKEKKEAEEKAAKEAYEAAVKLGVQRSLDAQAAIAASAAYSNAQMAAIDAVADESRQRAQEVFNDRATLGQQEAKAEADRIKAEEQARKNSYASGQQAYADACNANAKAFADGEAKKDADIKVTAEKFKARDKAQAESAAAANKAALDSFMTYEKMATQAMTASTDTIADTVLSSAAQIGMASANVIGYIVAAVAVVVQSGIDLFRQSEIAAQKSAAAVKNSESDVLNNKIKSNKTQLQNTLDAIDAETYARLKANGMIDEANQRGVEAKKAQLDEELAASLQAQGMLSDSEMVERAKLKAIRGDATAEEISMLSERELVEVTYAQKKKAIDDEIAAGEEKKRKAKEAADAVDRKYQHDRAVIDQTMAIASAKIAKQKALGEMPWFSSDTERGTVGNSYDAIIKSLEALEIPAYAKGGRNIPGGLSLVGERGPELINAPRGSNVYNNSETRNMQRNSNVTNNYNFPVPDNAAIRRLQLIQQRELAAGIL